ncbi:MAG: DUF1700 domain-containing protein [Hominilimicola sp.]
MNKNEFLNQLTSALSGLPQEEIKKTLDYYSEIIDDAVEDGDDEQEVIARLGSIEEIAEKIINETPIRKFVKEDVKSYNMSIPVIILLIIGSPIWLSLLISVFAVVFSLYAAIWSVVAALFAVFAALALSGVALIIASPFLILVKPVEAMFSFGTALICAGISVFLFFLSVWSAKMIIKLTILTVRKIKDIFIKKRSGVR